MPAINMPLVDKVVQLPATLESLVPLHSMLDGFWNEFEHTPIVGADKMWRLQFDTALVEISTNIIRHAYGGGASGMMCIRLRLYDSYVAARLSDTGQPYMASPPTVLWDFDDPFGLPEGGMGMMIARTALDYLAYRRTPSGVNCWRLVKRLNS